MYIIMKRVFSTTSSCIKTLLSNTQPISIFCVSLFKTKTSKQNQINLKSLNNNIAHTFNIYVYLCVHYGGCTEMRFDEMLNKPE